MPDKVDTIFNTNLMQNKKQKQNPNQKSNFYTNRYIL
jgi:hypothetical protein